MAPSASVSANDRGGARIFTIASMRDFDGIQFAIRFNDVQVFEEMETA
jgi:hypothetical protein